MLSLSNDTSISKYFVAGPDLTFDAKNNNIQLDLI